MYNNGNIQCSVHIAHIVSHTTYNTIVYYSSLVAALKLVQSAIPGRPKILLGPLHQSELNVHVSYVRTYYLTSRWSSDINACPEQMQQLLDKPWTSFTSQKLKYVGCTHDTSYDLSGWKEKVLQSRLSHLKSVLSTGLKYVILYCLWGHSVNSAAPHQGVLVGICMLARPLWLAEDQSDWNVLTIKWGHWLCGQIYFMPTS